MNLGLGGQEIDIVLAGLPGLFDCDVLGTDILEADGVSVDRNDQLGPVPLPSGVMLRVRVFAVDQLDGLAVLVLYGASCMGRVGDGDVDQRTVVGDDDDLACSHFDRDGVGCHLGRGTVGLRHEVALRDIVRVDIVHGHESGLHVHAVVDYSVVGYGLGCIRYGVCAVEVLRPDPDIGGVVGLDILSEHDDLAAGRAGDGIGTVDEVERFSIVEIPCVDSV